MIPGRLEYGRVEAGIGRDENQQSTDAREIGSHAPDKLAKGESSPMRHCDAKTVPMTVVVSSSTGERVEGRVFESPAATTNKKPG